MLAAGEGIARKSAGLGPGGRPKSGITGGFPDGCWVSGGAGGADRLQAELRAASRYGTGAAPQPSRALALPAKISARVSDDGAMRGGVVLPAQSHSGATEVESASWDNRKMDISL